MIRNDGSIPMPEGDHLRPWSEIDLIQVQIAQASERKIFTISPRSFGYFRLFLVGTVSALSPIRFGSTWQYALGRDRCINASSISTMVFLTKAFSPTDLHPSQKWPPSRSPLALS